MTVRILTGDCREVLATLPDCSVQCAVTSPPYFALRSYLPDGHPDKAREVGTEQTPDAYVAELVAVFREVRRVLADSGVIFLNLGDTYASNWPCNRRNVVGSGSLPNGKREARPPRMGGDLKDKDLIGIPWMVAFALRADGWWLRSDIIWAKPSCMPESVTDRPTSAHEHVFLLTKQAKYFYDADAVKEPTASLDPNHTSYRPNSVEIAGAGRKEFSAKNGASMRSYDPAGRNLRNVWTIATRPEGISHFALMPPDLASICVRAGSSERGQCPHCSAPWARVTGKGEPDREWQRRSGGDANGEYHGASTKGHAAAGVQDASAVKARILAGMAPTLTLGWSPTCACPAHKPVPQTVLDPFSGAGTTLLVADRLGRNGIGIELNPAYSALASNRVMNDAPLFAEVAD